MHIGIIGILGSRIIDVYNIFFIYKKNNKIDMIIGYECVKSFYDNINYNKYN
jgi:hypothetical protein